MGLPSPSCPTAAHPGGDEPRPYIKICRVGQNNAPLGTDIQNTPGGLLHSSGATYRTASSSTRSGIRKVFFASSERRVSSL